ncbi:MAG: hypothetical protein ACRCX1_13105, partial [Bacteroidales bacterium]
RGARELNKKEVIINTADMHKVRMMLTDLDDSIAGFMKEASKPRNFSYFNLWVKGDNFTVVAQMSELIESIVEELLNSEDSAFFYKISEYPVLQIEKMHIIPKNKYIRWFMGIIFPIGIVIYIFALIQRRVLKSDLQNILRINAEISNLIKK